MVQAGKFEKGRRIVKVFGRIFFPDWMVNRRVRITASGWFYLGLIFLFGIAAINTGNNLLYLILSVMISVLLASFWLSEMMLTDFKISRQIPESVYAGEEFSLVYSIWNQKRFFPIFGIHLEEKIENQKVQVYFLAVGAGKTERAYTSLLLKRRGRAKLKEIIVSTRFPFGFFDKAKRVNLREEIVVMPMPVAVDFSSQVSDSLQGIVHTAKKGRGDELISFKPYIPGDPPHLISWKASARAGKILVKETEQEAEQSLTIILKLVRKRPKTDSEQRESLIQKAFGLSKIYLEQGFKVRLEIEGRGVDFGAGLEHLRRIGIFLALFDDEQEPILGEELEEVFPSGVQLVLGESEG